MLICFSFGGVATFFFFKQKTAYELRISDWSSDVCSSDLLAYGEIPYREGPLAKKDKELILSAVFASPVAPQPDAMRRHIRQALAHGATAEEIADVLQLSSAIAIHSCVAAVPALVAAANPGT